MSALISTRVCVCVCTCINRYSIFHTFLAKCAVFHKYILQVIYWLVMSGNCRAVRRQTSEDLDRYV